jgi:hypothetical protein
MAPTHANGVHEDDSWKAEYIENLKKKLTQDISSLTINRKNSVNANRNTPHTTHDRIDKGRRFTRAINSGLKKDTNKFIHPAPRLAHLASAEDNPIFSKMETE